MRRVLISSSTFVLALILATPISSVSFATASQCSSAASGFAGAAIPGHWQVSENLVLWNERTPDGFRYFAQAGLNRAGVVYLNLRLVNADGVHRSTSLSGKKFVDIALEHFRRNGQLVSGMKGWWTFRPNNQPGSSLSEQIDDNPHFSDNFTKYWSHRVSENDTEAATKTWTAQTARKSGFDELARVSEFSDRAGEFTIFANFVSHRIPRADLRKSILSGAKEIEVSLNDANKYGLLAESFSNSQLTELFNASADQPILIKFVESNSQIAADFMVLGFQVVSVQRRQNDRLGYEIFITVR